MLPVLALLSLWDGALAHTQISHEVCVCVWGDSNSKVQDDLSVFLRYLFDLRPGKGQRLEYPSKTTKMQKTAQKNTKPG